MRKSFDLRVYVSPEEQLRLHWKIIRDSTKRGYSKDTVLRILEQRKDDSVSFISVQEKHADIIFSLRNKTSLGQRLGEKDTPLELSLFISCANDVPLEPLLNALSKRLVVEYAIFDTKQHIKISGEIDACTVEEIANRICPQLNDINYSGSFWKEGYEGVMQLFVVYYMFETISLSYHGIH